MLDSQNWKNSSQKNQEQEEDTRCFKCVKRRGIEKNYFAVCKHTGFCRACCQKQLLSAISNQRKPVCLKQECNEQMATTGNNIMFQYFSRSAKESWNNMSSIRNSKISERCSDLECSGYIRASKCNDCGNFYCAKCKKVQHLGPCIVEKQEEETVSEKKEVRKPSICQRLCCCFGVK